MTDRTSRPIADAGPVRRARKGERGSVLVVCVGVLAILALMAAAFISAMTMHKAVGANVKGRVHAELAAKSGLSHAVARLIDHHDNGTVTALDGASADSAWFQDFVALDRDVNDVPPVYNPNEVTTVLSDLYEINAQYQLYPHDDEFRFHLSQWLPNENGQVADAQARLRTRYAVVTLDLTGLLYCNIPGAATGPERDLLAAASVHNRPPFQPDEATYQDITFARDFYDACATDPAETFLDAMSKSQLTTLSDQQEYGLMFTRATPFGDTAEDRRGAGHHPTFSALNLNTAPKALRNALIVYTSDLLAGTGAGAYGIDGVNALQAGDGTDIPATYIGPLGDAEAFTDLFGVEYPLGDGTGSPATVEGSYYEADIAEALKLTMERFGLGATMGGAGYPCTDLTVFEDDFFTESTSVQLEAYDQILAVYNQDQGINPQPGEWWYNAAAGTWWNPPVPTCTERAERMERAVNDVLNSLFNESASGHDDDGTDGLYHVDFDGSEFGTGTSAGWDFVSPPPGNTPTISHQPVPAEASESRTEGETNATGTAWGQLPEVYVGKSPWFYVAVRGECGRDDGAGAWQETLSTTYLEAVVHVYENPAGSGNYDHEIMYRRWYVD